MAAIYSNGGNRWYFLGFNFTKRDALSSIYKISMASIPKVVGSNLTVVRHIFQACPMWIYTQSNITQASYSPEYITPTQQISYFEET